MHACVCVIVHNCCTQHIAVLIIFTLNLQTNIIPLMQSIREGGHLAQYVITDVGLCLLPLVFAVKIKINQNQSMYVEITSSPIRHREYITYLVLSYSRSRSRYSIALLSPVSSPLSTEEQVSLAFIVGVCFMR